MSGTAALVIGAGGGIGSAVAAALRQGGAYAEILEIGRSTKPGLDLLDEGSIRACAQRVADRAGDLELVIDATGALRQEGRAPEKSWREIDSKVMAKAFAVNATGPALLMKHFLPLLSREERSVFATLSARVGSIGDNRLGGWYAYRASKAALNQLVRTAAVELGRRNPLAICVALHPGTVRTPLTEGYSKSGLEVQEPDKAAARILSVLNSLTPENSGGFYDQNGLAVPW